MEREMEREMERKRETLKEIETLRGRERAGARAHQVHKT